jgi:hypothetical protein
MLRKSLIGLALAASLGGCAQFQTDWNVLTGATISPTAVIVSANVFDGLEAAATTYLNLPPCPTVTKVCRASQAVPGIVQAIRAGRTARNSLEALLAANSNAAIPVASYNTLTAAVSTLQSLFAQYSVTVVSAN